jgi:RNA polymerase sigma-70 factor (ECF subfamily)
METANDKSEHDAGADQDTWAAHYAEHSSSVRAYLGARVSSKELAEDLLQQTFLRLVQRANRASIENPWAYIRATASHVLADHYRSSQARQAGKFVEFSEEQHEGRDATPGRWLQTQEQMGQLERALGTLSKQVRRSFILSRVNGHTYAEIGEILSISPRTVEKHVAKGLATCFRHLQKFARSEEASENTEE